MAPLPGRAATGSRLFVTFVFTLIGLAFITETAVMIWEFRAPLAIPMLAFDSQTFLFFPTFGIIALFAFWRAAVVLVDANWRHIKGGKVALLLSLAVIGAIAGYFTLTFQSSENRLWWEVDKAALVADQGEPAGCEPPGCDRAPVVQAHETVRFLARSGSGLVGFSESCEDEQMTRFRPREDRVNFCFVTGSELPVAECCAARERFKATVTALANESPSLTYHVHKFALPFKAFFLLMLLLIGLMLARSRTVLEANYPRGMVEVERNIPVGTLSMLLWPLMNQAYTQSYDLLYGSGAAGAFRITAPLYTVAFGGWVMLLLFYYFRRYPKETEGAAKVMGGLAAGLSILNFDLILSWVNRFIGAGTNEVSISVMLVIVMFALWEVIFNAVEKKTAEAERDENGELVIGE
ncbi:MAG: hypothetical protein PVI23_13860 [Maricaulaceae bacterium]|jgi:hypothetical protein